MGHNLGRRHVHSMGQLLRVKSLCCQKVKTRTTIGEKYSYCLIDRLYHGNMSLECVRLVDSKQIWSYERSGPAFLTKGFVTQIVQEDRGVTIILGIRLVEHKRLKYVPFHFLPQPVKNKNVYPRKWQLYRCFIPGFRHWNLPVSLSKRVPDTSNDNFFEYRKISGDYDIAPFFYYGSSGTVLVHLPKESCTLIDISKVSPHLF